MSWPTFAICFRISSEFTFAASYSTASSCFSADQLADVAPLFLAVVSILYLHIPHSPFTLKVDLVMVCANTKLVNRSEKARRLFNNVFIF